MLLLRRTSSKNIYIRVVFLLISILFVLNSDTLHPIHAPLQKKTSNCIALSTHFILLKIHMYKDTLHNKSAYSTIA
jgi:hypothetical protein